MTVRFKFAEPVNLSVVEINPDSGSVMTTDTQALIEYTMHEANDPTRSYVDIDIRGQSFELVDVEELIAFLECVRNRLKEWQS